MDIIIPNKETINYVQYVQIIKQKETKELVLFVVCSDPEFGGYSKYIQFSDMVEGFQIVE